MLSRTVLTQENWTKEHGELQEAVRKAEGEEEQVDGQTILLG